MKHEQFIMRKDRTPMAHIYDMADGVHASISSMCSKVLCAKPPSDPGDGRPVCRVCAASAKRKGYINTED